MILKRQPFKCFFPVEKFMPRDTYRTYFPHQVETRFMVDNQDSVSETESSEWNYYPRLRICCNNNNIYLFIPNVAMKCPELNVPSNAVLLSPSCGNLYGTNCVFGCHYGYASNSGNVTRTCSQSGDWSGSAIKCIGERHVIIK